MCNLPSLSEALDPAGLSREGQAAAGWKEVFDPAGFHEGVLSGQMPKGHDPLQLSKGWHESWSELTGATAREEGEKKLAATEAQEAIAEAEERRRAAKNLAAGGGAGRGRASTMLTGPSGLLGDGTSARRTLMAG
jgi:hypothetical protein